MLGKLAVALRSIASALEEIEENKGKAGWEVVEEVEEQPQEPPPTCQPCGSDVAYLDHKDIRYYIVYWVGARSRSFEAFGVVKLRLHGGPWRAN